MKSKLLLPGVALACSVLLAGCASLPTSSTPKPLDKVEVSAPADYVISPAKPEDGASASEIASGFIRAGVGVSNNYAVARAYLSTDLSSSWQPETNTTVLSGEPTVSCATSQSCTVTITKVGNVDDKGTYTTASGTAKVSLSLKKEDDEWRITAAPDGTYVIRSDFEKAFRQRMVYFVAQDGSHLVPDVRWFPNTTNTPTKLVQALLSGPSKWLDPAVSSALPESTRLTVDAVTVSGTSTEVSLASETLDSTAQALVAAQLEGTLIGVNGIKTVNIMINGVGVDADSDAADISDNSQTSALGTLLATSSGVSVMDAVTASASADATAPLAVTGITSIARYGSVTAYSTGSGLYTTDGQSTTQLAKGEYANVSIDAYGLVWARKGTQVIAFDGTTKITVGGLPDIARVAVATDGTRIAYITSDSKLRMAAIIRGQKSLSVTSGHTLHTLTSKGIGLAWASPGGLVLAQDSGSKDKVLSFGLNGVTTNYSSPGAVADLVAGNSSDSVRVLTTSGAALTLRGTGWVTSAKSVTGIGLVYN